MAIVSKSGFKRNTRLLASTGACGSSYVHFGGPYYYTTWVNNPGHVLLDIVYRTWYSDTAWKAVRAANGFLPTRQMTVRRIYGKQTPVTFDRTQHTDGPIYSRTVGAAWNMDPGTVPTVLPGNFSSLGVNHPAVKAAKNRCLERARDVKVNVPIALAEGRKTVDMLLDTARKLAEAYKQFRKGNFRRVAEIFGVKPGGASSNWLAYQLGWIPLLSDIKGLGDLAMQELALGGRAPRFMVRGKFQEDGSRYALIGSNDPLQKENIGGYTESTLEISPPEIVAKSWLYLEVEYSDAALASQLGFGGFLDLASVAWELVPFSFVFDYVYNMGEMLAVASSLKGLKVLDGGCSLEQSADVKKYASRPAWYSNYAFSWVNSGPVYKGTDQYYQRFTWNGDVPGAITWRGFDGLNAKRLTTLAALLRQQFR